MAQLGLSRGGMDIHKPKPLHGWRTFLAEVGTIVLGVVIALGAEQAVDALHWQGKVAEAREAMRLELRDDDVLQAYTRAASAGCYAKPLDAIQAAVEAGADRRAIMALAQAYRPPLRTWDTEAWAAVLSSDVASHVSARQMTRWSGPYRLIPALRAVNQEEQENLVQLRAGRRTPGRLSENEADRILLAVEALRQDDRQMSVGSLYLLVAAADAGIETPESQKRQILAALGAKLGACVAAPSTKGLDLNAQVTTPRAPGG